MTLPAAWKVLPKELMELQLGQIDLLVAMYASDDSISMQETTQRLIELLRDWCEGVQESAPALNEPEVALLLSLDIVDSEEQPDVESRVLQVDLSVPLAHQGEVPAEPPHVRLRIRQPAWLSKAEVARLNMDIPDEDVLTAIEHVKEASLQYASKPQTPAVASQDKDAPIVRAWFYFPSISTRSKRDDIVNYAPTYALTGFLLAGKPGVLCLEGPSQNIDDYMKFIKTESWGDIPPQHKKVSERYRETDAQVKRAFQDMQEITDKLGERRGERANRNDMKALETWLCERQLGDAFAKVLI
ncbi:hypothetical protein B0I35DRAFT_349544 [Stachybotrys elegans]|uniref:Small nuclear ribonucleoprotein Prp3 C-terminal domain-containing protein n=1 Tax=Stachybotrys elegans TaxID=80388 RepID=A0A8K0SSV2_9HYPO|nr:hypothetical protein B0I35DRAFT_349544 [Stachybotrys elegans]